MYPSRCILADAPLKNIKTFKVFILFGAEMLIHKLTQVIQVFSKSQRSDGSGSDALGKCFSV